MGPLLIVAHQCGPGFCFPVTRWNGSEYKFHRSEDEGGSPAGAKNNGVTSARRSEYRDRTGAGHEIVVRRAVRYCFRMKILLADDHALVRSGLSLLLCRLFANAEVVEAGDYSQALQLCREHDTFALILVDRMMPGMADGDGLRALCQQADGIPVVVLSASGDPAHIHAALACGARGYLPKTTNEQVMFSALQLVLSGGTYLPAALLMQMSDDSGTAAMHARASAAASLTPRQREILERIAVGMANKEIAREFDISPATVQSHLNAIFRALFVTNRTEAVHVARQAGLLQDTDNSRRSFDA